MLLVSQLFLKAHGLCVIVLGHASSISWWCQFVISLALQHIGMYIFVLLKTCIESYDKFLFHADKILVLKIEKQLISSKVLLKNFWFFFCFNWSVNHAPSWELQERKLENHKLSLCVFACLSFAAIFIVDLSYVLFSVSDWHQLSSFMLFFVFHIYLYSLELVVLVALFFCSHKNDKCCKVYICFLQKGFDMWTLCRLRVRHYVECVWRHCTVIWCWLFVCVYVNSWWHWATCHRQRALICLLCTFKQSFFSTIRRLSLTLSQQVIQMISQGWQFVEETTWKQLLMLELLNTYWQPTYSTTLFLFRKSSWRWSALVFWMRVCGMVNCNLRGAVWRK